MIPAIQRMYGANEWVAMNSSSLAVELMKPATLRRMSLIDLFRYATGAGADPTEFRSLWAYGEFVQRMESALQDGDLAGVQALLATMPVDLTAGTLAAVQQVVAENTLSRLRANWPDVVDAAGNPAPDPPDVVDAAWVDATLTAAGYSWDGSQWVRV